MNNYSIKPIRYSDFFEWLKLIIIELGVQSVGKGFEIASGDIKIGTFTVHFSAAIRLVDQYVRSIKSLLLQYIVMNALVGKQT